MSQFKLQRRQRLRITDSYGHTTDHGYSEWEDSDRELTGRAEVHAGKVAQVEVTGMITRTKRIYPKVRRPWWLRWMGEHRTDYDNYSIEETSCVEAWMVPVDLLRIIEIRSDITLVERTLLGAE